MGIAEPGVGSFMPYANDDVESEVNNIAWTADLETGIDVLDEQHHRYVDLLNDYIEKVIEYTKSAEKEAAHLSESLNFLRQYAEEHFATEDSIMKDADFPDFDIHQEEHSHFLKHVGDLCTELETKGFSPRLSREVNYYTIEWFIKHILVLDMQLVEFLKAKNWKG